jgi:hypothetical protein
VINDVSDDEPQAIAAMLNTVPTAYANAKSTAYITMPEFQLKPPELTAKNSIAARLVRKPKKNTPLPCVF